MNDLRACDPLAEQRQSLLAQVPVVRTYQSYGEGLADSPHVVLIATPPKLHIPMAMEAIRCGCHVLCEKPLSDTSEGVEELERLAVREKKKLMVAMCFRYHDGHRKARQDLDSDRVGRLVCIRALMGEHLPEVRPDYRTLFTSQYCGAFDLTHEIDLAMWYAREPVRSVHCVSGTYSDIGIDAPDLVEMVLDFEGRKVASIHLDFFQRPRRRQMELICTERVILVEFARWERCTVSIYEAARSWKRRGARESRLRKTVKLGPLPPVGYSL